MKILEIKNMPDEELIVKLDSFKRESARLRFRKALSELQDTSRIKLVRRAIARLKFAISERKKNSKNMSN